MGEGFRGASVSLQLPCSPKPPALRPPCRAQIENFASGTPAGVCSLHGWTGTVRHVGGWPDFWRQGQSGHCDTDGGGEGEWLSTNSLSSGSYRGGSGDARGPDSEMHGCHLEIHPRPCSVERLYPVTEGGSPRPPVGQMGIGSLCGAGHGADAPKVGHPQCL